MPTFSEEFGRRVARRRHILRLKQYEVAAAIGSQRSYISAIEHGRTQMLHLEQLRALSQILQTSSDYLLQLTDEDPGVIPPWLCPGKALSLASVPLSLHTTAP
jgi:transcriptional regulator with XRE-family HTH domain